MALIAAAVAWLMLAGAVRAASLGASFVVSVQVVGSCDVQPTAALMNAAALQLWCRRGTGYQILVDGRPAAAGDDDLRIQAYTLADGTIPSRASLARLHWVTILY